MSSIDPTHLKKLTLPGITFLAALDERGNLGRVGDLFDKLLAAARHDSLPHIHTVVVSEEQRQDVKKIDSALLNDAPHAEFRVIFAADLAEAVRLLAVDAETRWGAIVDCTMELDSHRDFVGRQWLKGEVEAFVQSPGGGYLLLAGGPGLGKSAFIAELIRSSHPQAPSAMHFIKQGRGDWDDPEVIVRSIRAQLRRHFAIPKSEASQPGGGMGRPASVLLPVLQEVKRKLPNDGKALILIDGLDEAFGPTGRFSRVALPGVLRLELPEGIKIVLSSRPGEFLSWLADPRACQMLELDPTGGDNRADIKDYLQQQNKRRRLGLGDGFVARLAEAGEGYFIAAELYLRERDTLSSDLLEWQRKPNLIPKGLTGWLKTQWARLSEAACQNGVPQEVLFALLGLMASAREPLSRNHLDAFFAAIIRDKTKGDGIGIGFMKPKELVRHVDDVLSMSTEFFEETEDSQGAAAPYRFFHTSLAEFILCKLSDSKKQDCQRLLATGCTGWRRFQGKVRDYALHYRLAHLVAGQQWEKVAEVFAEADFILELSHRFGFAGVHAGAQDVVKDEALPRKWTKAFMEWERFLRWRVERLRPLPEMYPQEVSNEFLPSAPEPLKTILRPLAQWRGADSYLRLKKVGGPEAITALGHTNEVTSVAISGDGRRVVSGSRDGTVKVWETESGECVNLLFFDSGVRAVSFVDVNPVRLSIGDGTGHVFAFEILSP